MLRSRLRVGGEPTRKLSITFENRPTSFIRIQADTGLLCLCQPDPEGFVRTWKLDWRLQPIAGA